MDSFSPGPPVAEPAPQLDTDEGLFAGLCSPASPSFPSSSAASFSPVLSAGYSQPGEALATSAPPPFEPSPPLASVMSAALSPSDLQLSRIGTNPLQPQGPVILLNVNLHREALSRVHAGIQPALSKPAFAPSTGRFVCGTEDQSPYGRAQNRIIFSQLDDSSSRVKEALDGGPVLWSYPVNDHVRDLQWIDDSHVLFAFGAKLGLLMVGSDYQMSTVEIVTFPDFHKDIIRETAVNTQNKHLVLSGGFDGQVFITDVSRIVADIGRHETRSENSVYIAKDVVASVRWSPFETTLASATTDTGWLHMFDIRAAIPSDDRRRRLPLVHDTGKIELFTHGYRDANTLLLGYGDGSFHLFDLRKNAVAQVFSDPYQKMVGDLAFNYRTKQFAVFGIPDVTLWHFNDRAINLGFHHTPCTPAPHINPHDRYFGYKTSGSFRQDREALAVTDSNGNFIVYDLGRARSDADG